MMRWARFEKQNHPCESQANGCKEETQEELRLCSAAQGKARIFSEGPASDSTVCTCTYSETVVHGLGITTTLPVTLSTLPWSFSWRYIEEWTHFKGSFIRRSACLTAAIRTIPGRAQTHSVQPTCPKKKR